MVDQQVNDDLKRRRYCSACGERFTTKEGGKKIQLPLIKCPIVAPDKELSPAQIAEVLTAQEANVANETARR